MNNASLAKSAQKIQDFLSEKGIQSSVVELSTTAHTAQQAADALGCDVAQIIKSLVFCTKETKKPILVLASGVNRVNEKAIARIIGEKIERANPEFVREVTGFAIGGIPPVGHKQVLDTYIDHDIFAYVEIWAAAGTPYAVFKMQPKDLEMLTGGKIINIKK